MDGSGSVDGHGHGLVCGIVHRDGFSTVHGDLPGLYGANALSVFRVEISFWLDRIDDSRFSGSQYRTIHVCHDAAGESNFPRHLRVIRLLVTMAMSIVRWIE